MERLRELQLALWREACRHIDVADSIADLVAAIDPFVPIEAMWLFSCSPGACALAASWSAEPAERARFSLSGADAASVSRFVRKGGLALLSPRRPGRSLAAPLAPALGARSVICGGLVRDSEPEGVVAWRLQHGAEADERISTLLASALEPLAVALDTSNRFHELESLRLAAEADRQRALRRLGRDSLDEPIIGLDGGLRAVMERVGIVAPSDVPALILGETGSGKEVVARAIHERSTRKDGPFLRVNCGAIPPELIDSQLFGHEKGSFTGATERRQGWFERADGGTLFLDEIGELPLEAQVRLLRVIQEGTLERVGGQDMIRVDCRIVAATHRDLPEMVRAKRFREDLWYRVAVFPLVLPPLRERREDLPALARHLVQRAALRFGLPEFEITEADIAALGAYDWPGNVRELAAVIDRAALLGQGHRLALGAAMGSVPSSWTDRAPTPRTAPVSSGLSLDDAVRAAITSALERSHGKVEGPGGAAELLHINSNTLRSKMRKLGVRPDKRKAR